MFEDFFESQLPAIYAKMHINYENLNKNKEFVVEIGRISNLKDRIREMGEKEKKDKNADETSEIIKEILNYKKNAQKLFQSASKVNKKKTELN